MSEITINSNETQSKFNWIAFLFPGPYYAGKGQLNKGLILSVITGTYTFAIFVCIYAGLKANKQLDRNKEFNWKNAVIAGIVQILVFSIIKTIISSVKG